jgi:hypothetical protein
VSSESLPASEFSVVEDDNVVPVELDAAPVVFVVVDADADVVP